ncbi:MAG: methylcrotonoyl-CoA carboxylase, partial [Chromatiales bacterium]|nr:methylcrotonoyl-CoA carboxylase [Chromatiales bacterium]
MTVLTSNVNPRSAQFAENAAAMSALVGRLRERAAIVKLGGHERAREKHLARGKLLPRDRVRKLLDIGSPFLEIGQFAAWGMYETDV